MISSSTLTLIIYVMALLAMAFFTLLERKILGYIQERKGPNKVAILGLPQPLADAMKLLLKEQTFPSMANMSSFTAAPMLSLTLSLMLWSLYPFHHPISFMIMSILMFLCISSLNVYTTLAAGWFSNSKYALLGALRSVAQTISYEVSMSLILLSPVLMYLTLTLTHITKTSLIMPMFMSPVLFMCWFTTTLAETNRTPFDFAEGESELVSGFNTEYSSGTFALLFMAEYASIIIMSLFTSILFIPLWPSSLISDACDMMKTMFIASTFLWIRGTLPRMRYDRLMSLTWKSFLLFSLVMLMINLPTSSILWHYAGMNGYPWCG